MFLSFAVNILAMQEKFDIGITIYNEEKNLGNLLTFLRKEKFNILLNSILIVCSGCTDSSEDIVRNFMKDNHRVKLIVERERMGKYSAINKILKASRADYLILLNGDTLPRRNSINILLESLMKGKIGAVSGKPVFKIRDNSTLGYIQDFIWRYHDEMARNVPTISGELCGLRKDAVRKIPDKIINDDEFIAAYVSKYHPIKYAPNAITEVIENMTIGQYVVKRIRFAQGHLQIENMGLRMPEMSLRKYQYILKSIFNDPKRILSIFLICLIEIYAVFHAFLDIRMGKIYYKWET